MINPPIRQIVTQSDPKGTVPLCHFEKTAQGDCPFWVTKKMSQHILYFARLVLSSRRKFH